MKVCKLCGIEQNLGNFPNDSRIKDGKAARCRKCCQIKKSIYFKTKKGLISRIYSEQLTSSKKRKDPPPSYSSLELYNWINENTLFNKIYFNWVENNYKIELKPSIDRLNDHESYNLNNIRLVTWENNRNQVYLDKINGLNNKQSVSVSQYDLNSELIKIYYSQRQAERETGIHQSSIQRVCVGKQKTAGGFIWKITKDEH